MNMSKLKIKIRKITISDIDEIYEIEKACHGENHWSKDSLYSEINNNLARYYCAVDNSDRIIAFIGFWIIFEEAHLTTISVCKEFQNNKIAQALMNVMILNCYKEMVKYITLEVRVSNEYAIRLYKKFALKSVGVRKKYYQDNNEDALIMFSENIFNEKLKSLYNQNMFIQNLEVDYE